jgi:hypothetical protein
VKINKRIFTSNCAINLHKLKSRGHCLPMLTIRCAASECPCALSDRPDSVVLICIVSYFGSEQAFNPETSGLLT